MHNFTEIVTFLSLQMFEIHKLFKHRNSLGFVVNEVENVRYHTVQIFGGLLLDKCVAIKIQEQFNTLIEVEVLFVNYMQQ